MSKRAGGKKQNRGQRRHAGVWCLWTALLLPFSLVPSIGVEPGAQIQFNRDIRPILADNCFACHGPDANARKAGLRLDTKEGAFETTDKHGPALVPGDPAKSELWKRITTSDADDAMPPPKSRKELKPAQKEMLRAWILAGASWQGHWAFIKPERPSVPAVGGTVSNALVAADSKAEASIHNSRLNQGWVRNPIDAFIATKMDARGLTPSPEAGRRNLARRLSLDLTGLPPKPEDVEKFVSDRSPEAYEKLIDRWMSSPSWGEHRGRYWLDAARYADTHGLHFDNYREMWPYRDWVIRAFNRNMPFDQFVMEQIAGDLMENPTMDQLVATGFHRCNMTTNEGGTIEEENLANYANDRVTTTGWVFLGLTMNCSACHDHKFDPITMKDFYSMAAFFRNTRQTGYDRNWREGDDYFVVPPTESDRVRWKALPDEIGNGKHELNEQGKLADTAFTNWLEQVRVDMESKSIRFPGEEFRAAFNEGRGTNVTGMIKGKITRIGGSPGLGWKGGGPLGPGAILTKTNSFLVGDVGDFDSGEAFSLGAWVLVPEEFKGEGVVMARMGGKEEHYRGWEFFVRDDRFGVAIVNRRPSISMRVRSQEKSVTKGEWHHLFATYDGSTRASGFKLYIDGLPVAVNQAEDGLEGSIRTRLPLRIGRREHDGQADGLVVQDVRVHRSRLDASQIAAIAAAPRLRSLFTYADPGSTNSPAFEVLRNYFRATQHKGWQEASEKLAALESEKIAIRARSPVTHIQREKKDSEPMAQILFRGQYDKPREKVSSATPAALHPLAADAPRNRLGLAKWLVARENPLTARVTVNRFWQEVFGVGLVKSAEDFGTQGETPVNQALLDWLAVEFVESGWDVKHLFTLMLTSATYRQGAEVMAEKLEKDPQNRFLSRAPRFRMDAEMVRDYALATSRLLSGRLGGPSVRPYQPQGVWEAVAMPESNTRIYEKDTGNGLYRRSLYTFWKRAAPPATMDIFNAPSREVCAVRRERTNTPLQALATLNDPQFVEAARCLAESVLIRARGREERALDEIAALLLSRAFTPEERTLVKTTLSEMKSFYEQEPLEAKKLISGGESKISGKVPPAQLAAMTMVANQLMNLDEVLNK